MSNILETRVKKNSKYLLVETLDNITYDLIEEGIVGDVATAIGDLGTELAYSAADNLTGELGGVAIGLHRVKHNLEQIYDTIVESSEVMKSANLRSNEDREKLEQYQKDLRVDITDAFQGVITALPASLAGSAANLSVAAIENFETVTGIEIGGYLIEKLAALYASIVSMLEEKSKEGGAIGSIAKHIYSILSGEDLLLKVVTLDYKINGYPPLVLLFAGIRRMGEIDILLGTPQDKITMHLNSMPQHFNVDVT